MTTPTGTIKFSDITSEFGTPTGKNLGAFRVNQTIGGRQWPLDEGVPTSGTIRFSELRGKTCNVVVDYSGGTIMSNTSSVSRVSNTVEHVFNNEANTTTSLTIDPAAGITVQPQALTSDDPPYDGAVSVQFTLARAADNQNTITFTPVKSGYSNISFTRTSNGSEEVPKNLIPLLTYKVTGSSGDLRILDDGSDRKWGRKIGLDDGPGGGDDNDYNDLTVQVPGNKNTPGWNNSGGIFYKSGGDHYFVYYPSNSINSNSRKHYLITFSDGTSIPESDSSVSSIDVFPNLITINGELSTYTASGSLEYITVSRKERVSPTSFKVWFYGEADINRNPEDCPSNSFCRNFTISRNIITSNSPTPLTAKSSYESSGVVVGGFKSRESIGAGTKKVYHLIRTKIGGGLNSGSWESTTTSLNFIITGSGSIYGSGGKGGNGGNIDDSGDNGGNGGNALTLSYSSSVTVESGGVIAGGGGGGGGGGYKYNAGPDARGAGGGGGGGAGLPAGGAGAAGTVNNGGRFNNVCQGRPGSAGSLTLGGAGADITCNLTGGGRGGDGGDGGNLGSSGGVGESENTAGGQGGNAGAAIFKGSGVVVSLTNNGSILGAT